MRSNKIYALCKANKNFEKNALIKISTIQIRTNKGLNVKSRLGVDTYMKRKILLLNGIPICFSLISYSKKFRQVRSILIIHFREDAK